MHPSLDVGPSRGHDAAISPRFGKRGRHESEEAAARAEAARLASLPAPELAAEIMPAFGPNGPDQGDPPELNFLQIADWLMRAHPRGARHMRALESPIRGSVELLEVAGLVQRRGQSNRLSPTPVGQGALADGSVRLHLGHPQR
jgi:hypothetical protein